MRPILFSLGSLNFYSYGFFTAIGILAAGTVIDYLARKKRLLTKQHAEFFLIDGLLASLAAGIVAARVSYILLYNLIFQTENLASKNLITGGFIFYAGLAVGILVLAWWLKRAKENVMSWLDCLIIGITLGVGLSEIGGYLNDSLIVHLAGFVSYLTLAILGYAIFVTEKKPGLTFWVSLFLILLINFFMGFWRSEVILWYGLTLTQWVSFAGMVVLGFIQFRSKIS